MLLHHFDLLIIYLAKKGEVFTTHLLDNISETSEIIKEIKMMSCSNMMRRHLELQGPRPKPLVVSKNSRQEMKKKKQQQQQQPISSNPVIVYLISPKVIHVQPQEFMDLVQRLTGNNNNNNNNQG
ncbi:unnamed protein product [Prunus brigantina]